MAVVDNGVRAHRRQSTAAACAARGFDARQLDPLGGLQLTDDDFAWIMRELLAIAAASAQGRVVSILEGGCSLEGLASGTAAHVRTLMRA